ncbi:MAG: FHA domain-containing protein [Ignavibacteriae bacterium]|nr:FHA domain-containing protein [Ignavibacteriota bacterium]
MMSSNVEYLPDGMLVLNSQVQVPEVLDMLVVGGGPAGTAAAFHARELGLSVLVIDYDDLMKRIRDYSKEKLILPDFGGGDQMKFPKDGKLISLLHFSPIDKDELCQRWKHYYRDNTVPAQVGIELLGMQRLNDAAWEVRTWNHNTKTDQLYRARHVVVAIGRGVPRRFDIPGNTDGIAYRLVDASTYVGAPVLVIGGGTSAAEAVIAISNAKAKNGDSTAVYWSYRGEKLPKVSKAIAEMFFDAYMGNGNIRYYPNSEPVAVVRANDQRDYLSLRIDRRCIPGRPNETAHLEFPKEFCVACIGEDIPEKLLNSLGIFMLTGGPSNKKRMGVTPLLETQQPNVYLIGDLLSPAHLQTENFNLDPQTFQEVKHRGNIKAAIIDGVLVAKVIGQKLTGKQEINVELEFEDEVQPAIEKAQPVSVVSMITQQTVSLGKKQAVPEKPQAFLVRLTLAGVEEDEFPLTINGVTSIGKKFCDIVFPDDDFLADRHASVSHTTEGFYLRDDGSETGVFLRAREGKSLEIASSDLVRLGRQFLLFIADNSQWSFKHYDQVGNQIQRFILPQKTIVIGREAPDLILDPQDMTLSRRHLSITLRDSKIFIKDLKSVNGTYLKVRNSVHIEDGDEFRVGRQAFRLSIQTDRFSSAKSLIIKSTPGVTKQPFPQVILELPKKEGVITFKNTGNSFSITKGQTICDVAEKNGVPIIAECHAGICGSDPVRILSGHKNLNPITDGERETLEDICNVVPGECRLACMVKPMGPVEVEILQQ